MKITNIEGNADKTGIAHSLRVTVEVDNDEELSRLLRAAYNVGDAPLVKKAKSAAPSYNPKSGILRKPNKKKAASSLLKKDGTPRKPYTKSGKYAKKAKK